MIIDIDNIVTAFDLAVGRETTTNNGTGIDISGYKGNLKLVANYAQGGGTTPTLDIKVQESDVLGSGYTDITGKAFTQITDAADSLQSMSIDTRATKGFIRLVKTLTGTSPTFDGSVVGLGEAFD